MFISRLICTEITSGCCYLILRESIINNFSGDCKLCTTTEMLYMDLNISNTLSYAILKQNICMVSFYLQAHAINCGSIWLEVVVK